MAAKGDRNILEPQAKRLYAEGKTLTEISSLLGVSITSLSRWKADNKNPNQNLDEWDRAREQKRGNAQRLKDLFERELEWAEASEPGAISAASMDALSKLGSLTQKWDAIESTATAIDRPALFLENLDWIAKKLHEVDPEGLKILAKTFDLLVLQYKAAYAQTA